MRVRVLMLASCVAMATAAWAQAPAGKAEQAVLQAEKDRFAAMMKGDRAGLERVLADDLTYTHTNTLFESKAEFIKSVTSGAIDYVSVVPSESDWKVRIYGGSIAIVNGVAAVNVVDKGNDLKFKIRYTTVHRNEGGRWLLASWQATRFPQ
jgi:ABC-type molybdate transport system substrate-binding protein